MKNDLKQPSLNHVNSRTNLINKIRLLLFASLFLASSFNVAEASHYRYGNISWTRSTTGNVITFKISVSYRRSYFAGPPVVGTTINEIAINYGDGSSQAIPLIVTSINTAEDYFFAEATLNHTYASTGTYTAFYESSARLSTLQNNADLAYRNQTIVQVGNNNNSPVSTSAPIVNVASGQAATTFQIAAADPESQSLTYRFATNAEYLGSTQPSGMSVSTSGLVTFNTVGKTNGQLYNAAFVVTDALGATTMIDLIVRIVNSTTAPQFDYSVTPANGFVYDVQPGTPINFSVRAFDIDAGDNVTLTAVGLPTGATLTPNQPVSGNPVITAFSWTPTASQLGSRIIVFTAQDNSGTQATTSITITVGFNPVFNVPPTPVAGSTTCIRPSILYSSTIQASSPDATATVRITAATVVTGVSYSPTIPTPAGNTTSTTLSWTPTVSQFGPRTFNFTATDNNGRVRTHSFELVVNTQPAFTSMPVTTATVGLPYSYTVTVSDPDIPFGDVMSIISIGLPSWLTLSYTPGALTATLSGTPTASNVGANVVRLRAEDIYHHCYGNTEQLFTVNVSGSTAGCIVGSRLYVDTSAAPGGNGATWSCAYKQLYDAIEYANNVPSISEIWIADGVYKPRNNGNRNETFNLQRNGLRIVGGFSGNETSESQSNVVGNPTTLSGDVGTIGNTADNAYHLFVLTNLRYSGQLLFKSLIMQGSNANDVGGVTYASYVPDLFYDSCIVQNNYAPSGGAFYLDNTTARYQFCIFQNNSAVNGGVFLTFQSNVSFNRIFFFSNTATAGGAYYGNYGNPVFKDVLFSRNTAGDGGAVYHNQLNALYLNCVLDSNMATGFGGGIYLHNGSTARLVNGTLYGNTAASSGGGIYAGTNNPNVMAYNTILWNNRRAGSTSMSGSDIGFLTAGTPLTVRYSMLQAGTLVPADNGTTLFSNVRGVSPQFRSETNRVGPDGAWFTQDDGLQLTQPSPAVNSGENSIIAMNGLIQDPTDYARIMCGTVDRGAYELQTCMNPTLAEETIAAPMAIMAGVVPAREEAAITGVVANPFSGELQVRYAGKEKASINIVNASGRIISTKANVSSGVHRFDATSWGKGLYLVTITTANKQAVTLKAIRL